MQDIPGPVGDPLAHAMKRVIRGRRRPGRPCARSQALAVPAVDRDCPGPAPSAGACSVALTVLPQVKPSNGPATRATAPPSGNGHDTLETDPPYGMGHWGPDPPSGGAGQVVDAWRFSLPEFPAALRPVPARICERLAAAAFDRRTLYTRAMSTAADTGPSSARVDVLTL